MMEHNANRKIGIFIRLEPDTHKKLKEIAIKNSCSLGEIVAAIVEKTLKMNFTIIPTQIIFNNENNPPGGG